MSEWSRRQRKKRLIPRKVRLSTLIFLIGTQFLFTYMYYKELGQVFTYIETNIYQPYQGAWYILGWIVIISVLAFMFGLFVWLTWKLRQSDKKDAKLAEKEG